MESSTFSPERIYDILRGYDLNKITIATLASHSALQIFDGAATEGFKTLAITTPERRPVYETHRHAMRNAEFLEVANWKELLSPTVQQELINKNTIVIPHGSMVEYVGGESFANTFGVPTFGNRRSLPWEADRSLQRKWLIEYGERMLKMFEPPDEIDS